jgi:uncharacterized membrane protein
MQTVVIIALVATVAFMTTWIAAQAGEIRKEQGVFEIQTRDPISRTVLRAVQAAFVIGYGAFFALSIGYLILNI